MKKKSREWKFICRTYLLFAMESYYDFKQRYDKNQLVQRPMFSKSIPNCWEFGIQIGCKSRYFFWKIIREDVKSEINASSEDYYMAVNFFGTRKDNINLFQASEFMREAREKSTTDEHENSNGKLFERKKANKHERVAVEMKHSGLQELVSKKFARRKKQKFFGNIEAARKRSLERYF